MTKNFRTMTAQDAIAEGLFDLEDEMLAEALDLEETFADDPCGWLDFDHLDRMAEWEMALIAGDPTGARFPDPPAGTVWSDTTYAAHVVGLDPLETFGQAEWDEGEDEDGDYAGAWLHASPTEFFEAVGDAFTYEGPAAPTAGSVRAAGYIRVYELAREIGVDSSDMVLALCRTGEHVANHLAYVALPVADRMRGWAEEVVDFFGNRRPTEADVHNDVHALRRRLTAA